LIKIIEVSIKNLFKNVLGIVIFFVSFFDWISYVTFGWKLTSLAYWIDVVFMIVGIGIVFYNPEERKGRKAGNRIIEKN